ncbi:FkbM family methyltransferase [Streptomyces sp. NBC_00344]|uniref:FkbM family methyltransferase n=1 Tax=Streptomyces sp. NBC_00344 TaxID=2975720 RepID=UPI002E1F071D
MRDTSSEALVTLGRWYLRDAPGSLGKEWLAAQYLNAHLRDHPRRRVSEARFGARFAVDTQDLIQRYLYMFGGWEPNMTHWLKNRLRPGDTFVDVGANIGYFSVLASRLVGSTGQVAAIEASPAFHRRLLQNARLNECDNIRAVNTAVADTRKLLTFVLASSSNMGANSIVPYEGTAESTFETEALPLAEVLRTEEITTARVIKIDVEGAEGSAIRGLLPVIDQLRPDAEITTEVTPHRMTQLGDSVDELLGAMKRRGFHVYRMANDYTPQSYVAARRRPPPAPVRWRGPITGESDLVFSRTDAELLP